MGARISELKEVDSIRFFMSLDGLAAELAQSGDDRTRWIHVASAGDWHNMARGQVVITPDDLRTMHANFKSGIYPQAPTELPVDYEHLSTKPDRKPGDGIAGGWFKDLELRNNGLELWGLVEWLEDAADKIAKKQYRGFSPTLHPNWIAHGGKAIGPTLIGGALTNYPTMPLRTLTLSLDDAIAGDRLMVQGTSGPDTSTRGTSMKLIKVKNAAGEDVEIPLDSLGGLDIATLSQVNTSVKSLADKASQAPGDDKVVLPKTDLDTMRADLTTLSQTVNTLKATNDQQAARITELSQAEQRAKTAAHSATLDTLIREGRMYPAEKEEMLELAQANEALFTKFVEKRKAAKPMIELGQPHGSGGIGTPVVGDGEQKAAKMVELANAYMTAHKVDYATACRELGRSNAEYIALANDVRTFESVEFASGPVAGR